MKYILFFGVKKLKQKSHNHANKGCIMKILKGSFKRNKL